MSKEPLRRGVNVLGGVARRVNSVCPDKDGTPRRQCTRRRRPRARAASCRPRILPAGRRRTLARPLSRPCARAGRHDARGAVRNPRIDAGDCETSRADGVGGITRAGNREPARYASVHCTTRLPWRCSVGTILDGPPRDANALPGVSIIGQNLAIGPAARRRAPCCGRRHSRPLAQWRRLHSAPCRRGRRLHAPIARSVRVSVPQDTQGAARGGPDCGASSGFAPNPGTEAGREARQRAEYASIAPAAAGQT